MRRINEMSFDIQVFLVRCVAALSHGGKIPDFGSYFRTQVRDSHPHGVATFGNVVSCSRYCSLVIAH